MTTFVTASITIEGSEIPALSIAAGIAGVGLILSFPLFAALTLRARVLPRWTALLMLAFMGAAAASMVPGVPERLNDLIVGIGLYVMFAGFGLALLTGAPRSRLGRARRSQPRCRTPSLWDSFSYAAWRSQAA